MRQILLTTPAPLDGHGRARATSTSPHFRNQRECATRGAVNVCPHPTVDTLEHPSSLFSCPRRRSRVVRRDKSRVRDPRGGSAPPGRLRAGSASSGRSALRSGFAQPYTEPCIPELQGKAANERL